MNEGVKAALCGFAGGLAVIIAWKIYLRLVLWWNKRQGWDFGDNP
ncbi:MAG TPA: hypothetical protein VF678_12045 [bacterium]